MCCASEVGEPCDDIGIELRILSFASVQLNPHLVVVHSAGVERVVKLICIAVAPTHRRRTAAPGRRSDVVRT